MWRKRETTNRTSIIGAVIPDQIWEQARQAFLADTQSNPAAVSTHFENWVENTLKTWVDLGVRKRKQFHPGTTAGKKTSRKIRCNTLSRAELASAWAADGGIGTLGEWITKGLLRGIQQTKQNHPEPLPTAPARLPTWKTPTRPGEDQAQPYS